jgi:hypothetical protein
MLTHPRYLSPGSRSPDRNPSSPSSDSSRLSITSSSEPEILYCNDPSCGETFRGKYRRGSLNRHKRLKHRGSSGIHPCAEPSCYRIFQRSETLPQAPPRARQRTSDPAWASKYATDRLITEVRRTSGWLKTWESTKISRSE